MIKTEHLSKRYDSLVAVDDVSFQVAPGEVLGFLGPNGAGKTTTIDMLLGLAAPDSGSVRVFGGTPHEALATGRISAVLQSGGLLPDLTVSETVQLIATLHTNPRPVEEVLARAGIAEIGGRMVGKCSGGQKQRLRFALALLPNPDLIVLDEPTTGMDVEGRRDFWNAMRQDSDRGRTVLFATHYLDEAEEFADRVVLMRDGLIIADGSVAEVRSAVSGRTLTAQVPGATLPAMLAQWDESRMDGLLLLADMPTAIGYDAQGDFILRTDRHVVRARGNTGATYAYPGVQIVHPRLFADAPEGAFSTNIMWDRAIAQGRLFGTVLDGTWIHVGTPQAREEAEAALAALSAA